LVSFFDVVDFAFAIRNLVSLWKTDREHRWRTKSRQT
jgi:hypothetical protein